MPKVAFYTLGCKVNQYETEAMAQLFKKNGYEISDFHQMADVYVINSCTVTNEGDRKSRQMIRRAVKKNPDAVVAVTGCYAQIAGEQLGEIPGLDVVIGTQDRDKIVAAVEQIAQERSKLVLVRDIMGTRQFEGLQVEEFGEKTRASVKIQEGCTQFCSYCIIPYVRGPVRSRPLGDIIAEVLRLVDKGYREVVLTGIHLGSYGTDLEEGIGLAQVVTELAQINDLARIRLSSIDSTHISDEFIALIAQEPKFCRHLHIPLQSGDDDILRGMNRRYTTEEYRRVVDHVRRQLPDVAITTDLIIGFPGETEKQFENTCRFVKQIGFSKMHVFSYSPRQGTPAAVLPNQIRKEVKEERSKVMHGIGAKMSEIYATTYLGKKVEVLVEGIVQDHPNLWQGLTDTYMRVELSGDRDYTGQLVKVKILGVKGEILQSKLQ